MMPPTIPPGSGTREEDFLAGGIAQAKAEPIGGGQAEEETTRIRILGSLGPARNQANRFTQPCRGAKPTRDGQSCIGRRESRMLHRNSPAAPEVQTVIILGVACRSQGRQEREPDERWPHQHQGNGANNLHDTIEGSNLPPSSACLRGRSATATTATLPRGAGPGNAFPDDAKATGKLRDGRSPDKLLEQA